MFLGEGIDLFLLMEIRWFQFVATQNSVLHP